MLIFATLVLCSLLRIVFSTYDIKLCSWPSTFHIYNNHATYNYSIRLETRSPADINYQAAELLQL